MTPVHRNPLLVSLALAAAFGVLAGCSRESASVTGPATPTPKSKPEDDKVSLALDLFRQPSAFGAEVAHYREALGLLSPSLSRSELQGQLRLTAAQRKLLEPALAANELEELEALAFRTIDTHHVESSALFRDAARKLEVGGIDELEQAGLVLDWVTRRVLLHEQRQEGIPPAYVLRAGYGSLAGRALVFQSLLHQFRLPTCWLVLPDAAEPNLVGVLQGGKVYLFDPRLGRPVRTPDGKGVATWESIHMEPDSLGAHFLDRKQVEKLEGRWVVPLESLAPRMKYLEGLLQGEEAHIGADRIGLFHDVAQESAAFAAAGLPVTLLAKSADMRALRRFLPPEEGGQDTAERWKQFTYNLVPWSPVFARYGQMRMLSELPRPAQLTLKVLTADLFEKYYKQPLEMLARGKVEALPRRLDRIRGVVEDAEFADPQEEQKLLELAAIWREQVNRAYLAALRGAPEGAEQVKKIWEEDVYLLYLLQPDLEVPPRGKRLLSRLVLAAVREPMGNRANLLLASLTHDKAERAEILLERQRAAGKDIKVAANNARTAWLNAKSGWHRYLDRSNLGTSIVPANLQAIRLRREQGDLEGAVTLLEYLHLELHQYVSAREQAAEALSHLGTPAQPALASLAGEIEKLAKDGRLADELKQTREALRGAAPAARAALDHRLGLLQRDWGPTGNFAWIVRRLEPRKPAA